MATDLDVAVAALTAKKRRYDALWRYYDGEQPLVYSSEAQEIFSGLEARFTENWCAVVVDSVLDRMGCRRRRWPAMNRRRRAACLGSRPAWSTTSMGSMRMWR